MPGYTDGYGSSPGTSYTFESGETTAQMDMNANPNLKVVAVETTDGVAIYADTNGDHAIDLAIQLPGALLSAVSALSFV